MAGGRVADLNARGPSSNYGRGNNWGK